MDPEAGWVPVVTAARCVCVRQRGGHLCPVIATLFSSRFPSGMNRDRWARRKKLGSAWIWSTLAPTAAILDVVFLVVEDSGMYLDFTAIVKEELIGHVWGFTAGWLSCRPLSVYRTPASSIPFDAWRSKMLGRGPLTKHSNHTIINIYICVCASIDYLTITALLITWQSLLYWLPDNHCSMFNGFVCDSFGKRIAYYVSHIPHVPCCVQCVVCVKLCSGGDGDGAKFKWFLCEFRGDQMRRKPYAVNWN